MPQFQIGFQLSNLQTGILDFSFYIGYFFAPIMAGILANKYGFKASILMGLTSIIIGSFSCANSAIHFEFMFFLIGLFVIAFGCGFLETSANPLSTLMGHKDYASFRINFAQIFNMAASVLTAFFGAQLVLGKVAYKTQEQLSNMSVNDISKYHHSLVSSATTPYLFIASILVLIFIVTLITKYPSAKDMGDAGRKSEGYLKTIQRLKNGKHFKWSLLPMFLFCCAQAGLWGFAIRYTMLYLNINPAQASIFYTYILIASLCGRIFASIMLRNFASHTFLGIMALLAMFSAIIASFVSGYPGVYALIAASFFMACMYPTIFSLGINKLGKDTKIASSFIVMMIIGCAVSPPIMGFIADHMKNFSVIELIPALCYLYIAFLPLKRL